MSNDEKEIRDLIATWISATEAGDTEKILGLMSDDVVFLVSGRPPMRKSEFASLSRDQSQKGRPKIDAVSEVQEVTIAGEWGFAWTKLKVIVTPPNGAKAVIRAGHTLSIYKKQNGKWALARDANLLAPLDENFEAFNQGAAPAEK